jgi:hypothetical protein
MEHKPTPFPKSRKLKSADGTVAYIWDGKLHNWDGPAYIPQGNNKLAEYHLYGIKRSKEEWNETKQQREGLPYYKNQSMRSNLSDYRN